MRRFNPGDCVVRRGSKASGTVEREFRPPIAGPPMRARYEVRWSRDVLAKISVCCQWLPLMHTPLGLHECSLMQTSP
jgi:hypothetical protein